MGALARIGKALYCSTAVYALYSCIASQQTVGAGLLRDGRGERHRGSHPRARAVFCTAADGSGDGQWLLRCVQVSSSKSAGQSPA